MILPRRQPSGSRHTPTRSRLLPRWRPMCENTGVPGHGPCQKSRDGSQLFAILRLHPYQVQ
eukprot:1131437-Rhodomonas_salina.3